MAVLSASDDYLKDVKYLTDKRLIDKLEEAKYLMKRNIIEGNHIKKRLFPKKYIDKYRINNLWRYPINGHRLLYTIVTEHNEKKYALLDILTHKKYDELFGYSTS